MDKRNKKDIYVENTKKALANSMSGIIGHFPGGGVPAKIIDTYRTVRKESKREIAQQEKPEYICSMGLYCRKGFVFSKKQQNQVAAILERDFESGDEEALKIIDLFIDEYMGGEIVLGSDDCYMGEDYLDFNFADGADYPYIEEDIILVMEAINRLLGENLFDRFDCGEADPCYGADYEEDEEE